MSTMRGLFKEDITRNINGVISAGSNGDENELELEFVEYVITNDVRKGLEEFFSYYNEKQPAKNGVWISGFFGSGKSHLLKILSYLLENDEINGKSCASFFETKLLDDKFLFNDIKNATAIPSESILFNIIQNNNGTDAVNKTGSLLPIFRRQFYDHLGYYGTDFTIAEIEKDLDEEGLLNSFISCFERLSGKSWKEARTRRNLCKGKIIKAYAEVTNQSEDENLFQNYEKTVTIKDFAQMVRKYINSKGDKFRLNFFVDEAGQFVVGSLRLMIELQEIATALSDQCNNRSWIIVTSQDALEKFTEKSREKIDQNDITKIIDRFPVKLKLTNENVTEVIQKRLLAKSQDGLNYTKIVYNHQKDNFDALLGFVDGPKKFRMYRDENEFANMYPFVYYQFDLFKVAFTGLSDHNAFPGENSYAGARSLLDVFHRIVSNAQYVNEDLANDPIIPFDAFYDAIDGDLKDNFKTPIFLAMNNLMDRNAFAIRVLKVLLLVKYIPTDFKPSLHNISTLLLTSFKDNPSEVQIKTQEALRFLEKETYIQRKNNDEYDFLTNEEKDVETEIRGRVITEDDIYDLLNTIIYKRLLQPITKAKDNAGNAYPFTKQIDSRIYGSQGGDLSLVIATSYGSDFSNIHMLCSDSSLVVLLEDDGKLFPDIELYLQTESYLKILDKDNLSEEKKSVTAQKNLFNADRYKNIESHIASYLEKAELFIHGVVLPISDNSNYRGRIEEGLRNLIYQSYPNLKMLPEMLYNDSLVNKAFTVDLSEGFDAGTESENLILSYINQEKQKGGNVSIKSLVENYRKIPYGWPEQATIYSVVILYRKGKILLKLNGQELTEPKVKETINQSMKWTTLLVELSEIIDAGKIKRVKNFIEDFTGKDPSADSANAVIEELKDVLTKKLDELNIIIDSHRYPFIKSLDEEKMLIKSCLNKSNGWYYDNEFKEISQKILDEEDKRGSCVLNFINNQKTLFDAAYDYIEEHKDDLNENNAAVWIPVTEILKCNDIERVSRWIKDLNRNLDFLKTNLDDELSDKKKSGLNEVENYRKSLLSNPKFSLLSDEGKAHVKEMLVSWGKEIPDAKTKKDVNSILYEWKHDIDTYIKNQNELIKESKVKSIVGLRSFNSVSEISTEDEVDKFISNLKEEMLEVVREGFKIKR